MKFNKLMRSLFLAFLFFSFTVIHAGISYDVNIEGIQDPDTLAALKSSSKLLSLAGRAPNSQIALKRRAEADITHFIKVLHGRAYYNAKVQISIDQSKDPVMVHFMIDPGQIYPLSEFKLVDTGSGREPDHLDTISLQDLGITLGAAADANTILIAEEKLLRLLAKRGFPQAAIKKRDLIADQQKKEIHVTLYIDSGQLARFGKTTISGNSDVKEDFFRKKISWKEGEIFNLQDIEKTQEALENSGLFNSATITYQNAISEDGRLAMDIQVIEAKQRSIAAGISFTTQRGVGLTAEWDHRNFRGLGERVSVRATLWKDTQDGKISYTLPDFGQQGQNLIWTAEVEHEKLKGYTETSFGASSILEKQINDTLKVSYGIQYKSILTSNSDNNGNFHLLKTPVHVRWSTANDLLNPTKGHSLNLKIAPTLQVKSPYFAYCPTTLTGTHYLPLTEDHRWVFASKMTVGSIIGASRHGIPPSERFYAGSENTLRGYRYMTVSPLDKHNDPIGGKSIMVGSFEARFRATEKIGVVGFYEIGNVYGNAVPQINHKQLQSVGAGLRYHTPIGPVRLDVAIPLNKRKGIDSNFQIYMSIGQSF